MSPLQLLPGEKYDGSRIELVVGIDIGTTFSGVSYAFLFPEAEPTIVSVMDFANQDQTSRKVPSVVYYDNGGECIGAGADVLDDEDDDVVKAEHFKLHLRPPGTELRTNGMHIGELPPGKSVEDVTSDFLRYLWGETVRYIKNHNIEGEYLLVEVNQRVHFVLGHPNGWAGRPQQRLRRSALAGGLVTSDEDARARISFVTEGEASALTCLASENAPRQLSEGYRLIILDAGGGTLDVSGFEVISCEPLRLKEFAVSISRFAGSIFVNTYGRDLVQDLLRDSKLDRDDILDDIISEDFENNAKPMFNSSDKTTRLRLGCRDSIPNRNIRNGVLSIPGERFAECFDFSVTQAVDAIRAAGNRVYRNANASGQVVKPVWLVGGFGRSPWLLKRLRDALGNDGYEFCQPDSKLSKAVADGAVRHYLYGNVSARMSAACYGTNCMTKYMPGKASHSSRPHLVDHSEVFGDRIGPIFSCIVKKHESVATSDLHYSSYFRRIFDAKDARFTRHDIYCYDEDGPMPYWFNEDKEKLQKLCEIEADLSDLCTEKSKLSLGGIPAYWRLEFDIEIKLGTTEIEARVKWKEGGTVRYGPARVVYG